MILALLGCGGVAEKVANHLRREEEKRLAATPKASKRLAPTPKEPQPKRTKLSVKQDNV